MTNTKVIEMLVHQSIRLQNKKFGKHPTQKMIKQPDILSTYQR